jgi:hypothetical protein
MAAPGPTPKFFEGITDPPSYPYRRDNVSVACLTGSLQRTSDYKEFPPPGNGDPGYFEFIFKVVPRVRDYVLGYAGYPGLRWLLGNIITGLKQRFNATHLAVLSQRLGNDKNFTEQVAVLNIMKVGPKLQQTVVEQGDFVMVKKESRTFPAQVLHLYMSLVDGEELLTVRPVRSSL